jgi:hypothetical protein
MVMIECYDNEKERAQHRLAMQRLARDLGLPVEKIGGLYEEVLGELKRTARVKDFLSILASRQVRDLLRDQKAA